MTVALGAFVLLALTVGLAVGVSAYVALPLWRGVTPIAPPDPRAVELLARREAILATLRDLDADLADAPSGTRPALWPVRCGVRPRRSPLGFRGSRR